MLRHLITDQTLKEAVVLRDIGTKSILVYYLSAYRLICVSVCPVKLNDVNTSNIGMLAIPTTSVLLSSID